MARGPYQGTFQPNARPTVVTGPDCIVMINQSTQIVGCPTCNKTFDINKYITSIQVDLSIDSVPGSASLNLSVPRHTIDDFFFDGDPVIQPMMEINIYAKGYYLVEGLPQYYPIFWGLVTEVNDSYSGGEHTVSIHCADILKWWELCRMNINPAYTSPIPSKFGQTLNGNVFAGMNPFDIIWNLAQQAFGDIVVGAGSLVSTVRDAPGQNTVFSGALSDLMAYWTSRFGLVASNLMMYGSTGVCVRGDVLQDQFQKHVSASATIRKASGGPETAQLLYDPTDPNVVATRTNNSNLGVNFWQSEFQTKLELANGAKEAIGYEFYMDVTGDIVFKPPFYNLDIISNKPVSWIQDIDIIDWDLSESESEVVTQLTIGGNYSGNVDWGWSAEMTPFSTVTDYHLLRQYGWRPQQVNSEFMGGGGDTLSMFYYGLDMLDRINSKRHRGTVTIPMRPELRLGFPIYIAPKDQIWYVQGISHNYQAGGRCTTQVTLTAKREKFKAPKGTGTIALTSYKQTAVKAANNTVTPPATPNPGGVSFPYTGRMLSDGGSFTLDVSNAVTLPPTPADLQAADPTNSPYDPLILRNPQTGRIVGYPNAVMAYIRPYAPSIGDWLVTAGDNPNQAAREKANKNLKQNIGTQLANQQAALTVDALSNLQEKHLQNRSWFGLTSAGSFMYAHDLGYVPGGIPSASVDAQGVVGELVLLPSGNLTVKNSAVTHPPSPGTKVMIRPISDSRGFEVIGHYRYGRGLSLTDGQLIDNGQQDTFQAANVSIQVALAGDLYASLTAQAQGLTQVAGNFPNPTAVLANLQPSDLQTAGFISPGQDTPQYSSAGTNFVTTSTLGSPQQTGVFPSVEASQLSQGLTLAEMTVLDPQGSQDGLSSTQPQCMCLLGRADLAFINQGYNVSTLTSTTNDPSSLPNPNAPGGVTNPGSIPGVAQGAVLGNPVQGSLYNLPPDQVTTIIDNYLFGLYQALDGPHQTYEQQLRGGIYQAPQPGANGSIQVGPTSAEGDLAPPFNPASQAAVGNPAAVIQMVDSATSNLSQAWSSFGQSLQTNTQIAQLTSSITNDQGNLAQLQARLNQLEAQQGSTFVGTPSLPQQIAALQQQIAALQQKIQGEETQLGQLRNQAQTQPSVPGAVPGAPTPPSTAFPPTSTTAFGPPGS